MHHGNGENRKRNSIKYQEIKTIDTFFTSINNYNVLSKWSISKHGILTHEKSWAINRRLRFVHVDDHQLFSKGFDTLVRPFFPKLEIIHIQNGTEALHYIENAIDEEKAIDLIVTDINHPGLRGDEMIKKIRFYEDLFRLPRIPIVVLTMVGEENLQHICGPGIDLISKYFSKASEADEIIETLEDILC